MVQVLEEKGWIVEGVRKAPMKKAYEEHRRTSIIVWKFVAFLKNFFEMTDAQWSRNR